MVRKSSAAGGGLDVADESPLGLPDMEVFGMFQKCASRHTLPSLPSTILDLRVSRPDDENLTLLKQVIGD